ncbi:MAG: CDP-diacylglycerol--glycerol-3-phosphate 3-phosphatidyltransferase [Bacilli bacterium]
MNLPNKITVVRIFGAILLLVLLMFPFSAIGFEFPKYLIGGKVLVDLKYLIGGVIFFLAAFTDFVDGYIARKYNMVTDFGKVMDAIADKMLVNGVLIVLAVNGYLSVVIPVVVIIRDIAVDSIKMIVGQKKEAVGASKLGKLKTVFMLVGITLIFFYNLPFELINLRIAEVCILIATVLSVVSGFEYYYKSKKLISSAE